MKTGTRDKSSKSLVDVSPSELEKTLAVNLEHSFRRWRFCDY